MMTEEQQERAVTSRKAEVGFSLGSGLAPSDLDGLYRIAKMVSDSGLAPKGITSPPAIMTAMAMGAEIGLSPLQAIQTIAVVNGRPSIFGDAAIGIVSASGLLEDHTEEPFGEPNTDGHGWRCTVKRVGRQSPASREFTISDAKRAGLWKKAGPWSQYPQRMLQMRARSWALRDVFADVLRGLRIGEEQRDVPVEPEYTVTTPQAPRTATSSDPTAPIVVDLGLPTFGGGA